MKRTLILIIASILSIYAANAQNFISINGKVVDNKTSDAISLASVNLKGTNISNVSNSEGFFSLKIPAGTPADAIISVSCLGYLSCEYPVSEFSKLASDVYLRIPLLPINLSLDAAVARVIDPEILINSAYSRIRKNYSDETVGMTAFYREMIKKGNSKYLVLNEAVLDIEKTSYSSYNSDKASIYKGRGNVNYEKSDTLFVQFQGGIAAALSLDMVKSPFIGTTLQSAPHFYDFSLSDIVNIDGKAFYVVGFKPKKDVEPFLFKGKIYIEEESLAIGRMEFSMDIGDKKEEAAGEFILKRPANMKFSMERADYIINFKEFEGLWYYDYARVDIEFNARKKSSLFKSSYSITSEMAVTDHKKGEFHVINDQKVQYKDILSNQVSAFQDEDFWEDYNVIEADQSIEQAIRRIIKQLQKRTN